MQQKRNKKTNKTAEQKALEILNYCMRSESELREKLSKFENFSKDDIDRAIEYVSYYGYLNDTVYAELYVAEECYGIFEYLFHYVQTGFVLAAGEPLNFTY